MLNRMASSTNTGGATASSSNKNAAQHLYQRHKETDQIRALEEYELDSAGSEETHRAHEIKILVSTPNEGPTSSNTEQEKKDSNEISSEEELHQELWKSFSNFRLFEYRINNPSRFKKKILAKERNQTQTQTELQHIHERFREAFVKLSELSTANQSAESTINLKARGKASSEEELEEKSEPQPIAESSTDLKGKVLSEEDLKIVELEQKINSQKELKKN